MEVIQKIETTYNVVLTKEEAVILKAYCSLVSLKDGEETYNVIGQLFTLLDRPV